MREPLENPDIVIRERRGTVRFVPETTRGEEWLVARAASHGDVRRPLIVLHQDPTAKPGEAGRLTSAGHKGAVRGFEVDDARIGEVHVLAAGLVIRRVS